MKQNLYDKIFESLSAVLPVTLIVLILSVTLVPMSGEMVFMFILGTAMLILGLGLFTLGVDQSMMIMGERIGAGITRTRKVPLIIITCFVIGVFITVAEPDLTVLAEQTPIAENMVIILSVALGVGIFLTIAFLRTLLKLKLSILLIVFYIITFVLALSPLISPDFIPVAFDSGGVTTGPITVPFVMALGLGLTAIRSDKKSEEDTFGLVALCSIGPILTVLILGALNGDAQAQPFTATEVLYDNVQQVAREFVVAIPDELKNVTIAIVPIAALCLLFQLVMIKLKSKEFKPVIIGFAITFVGLVLFLTGVNVGFMPVGLYLGKELGSSEIRWLLIPLGSVIGFFIVKAEPAVHVLKKQVEEVTLGRISGKSVGSALSIGIAVSVALAMTRVLTGISIVWFLIPGYAFSLLMTFFVPSLFTAIAFDSGGVASGPMTATFLLPFAMGACLGVGGDLAKDAFGIVAMVAMTPLITIQLLGLASKLSSRRIDVKALSELDELVYLLPNAAPQGG
ncbi:MAG: DUF1538 domain-containing protein [Oscillospiraceae bacterium]|jgi:hypothetical protein|nr:DUF1538 domain-containing protein [Oscillospiraceae bacterium]